MKCNGSTHCHFVPFAPPLSRVSFSFFLHFDWCQVKFCQLLSSFATATLSAVTHIVSRLTETVFFQL